MRVLNINVLLWSWEATELRNRLSIHAKCDCLAKLWLHWRDHGLRVSNHRWLKSRGWVC